MTTTEAPSGPTMSDSEVESEAALLDQAERDAKQIRQTTTVYAGMTMTDAYRVQASWRDRKLALGATVVGHKIGLTSRAMQTAMNITTPDSGFLTDDMVFAPDSTLEASRFCDPKVEIELAFVLASDLSGADVTINDVLAATEYVMPSVELIDARSHRKDATGRTRTVIDTIADNAADAGIVCGGEPIAPQKVDLRWVSALGYRNGIVEETGVAAGVLDHPAAGIVWLAQRYAQQGLTLEAGQTILAGSFTRPIDIRAGDEFRFDFGPHGSFSLSFT